MKTVLLAVLYITACFATEINSSDENVLSENKVSEERNCGPHKKGIKVGGNYCLYYENEDIRSWEEAENACVKGGGHLASLTSKDYTATFIDWAKETLLFDDKAWIGLHTVGLDGSYEWVDGKLVDYTNWRTTKKVFGETACVYIQADGKWDVTECKKRYGAICKTFTGITTTSTEGPSTNATEPHFEGYCPKGWVAFDDTCYQVFKSKVNWMDANSNCKRKGQDLVSVHTQEVQVFLTSLLARQNTSVWIGLNRTASAEIYQWSDESEFDFSNWAPRQPSDQKLCVEMLVDPSQAGKWNDSSCAQKQGFICQTGKDVNITSTVAPPDMCTFDNVTFYDYRNSCYNVFSVNGTSWFKAEKECEKFGGHLVSIMDAQEMAFIDLIRDDDQDLWIGFSANRTSFSGTFEWTDKWPVIISAWEKDQPMFMKDQKNGCVVLTDQSKWAVGDCEASRGFVCKVTKETPPSVKVPGDKCPHRGSVEWMNIGIDHCYYYNYESLRTWSEASEVCTQLAPGARLASFHSQNELDELQKKLTSKNETLWIGLARGHEKGFQWNDLSAVNFVSWADDQQSSKSGFDCVTLNGTNMTWYSSMCDNRQGFVCMIDKEDLTTSTQSTTATLHPPKCENDKWSYYEDYCYSFISNWMLSRNWDNSSKICKNFNSELASVHTEGENDFIYNHLKDLTSDIFDDLITDDSFWLGMYRPALFEPFFWSDETKVDFTKLNNSESPDPFNERHCVNIDRKTGKWNQVSCLSQDGMICKKSYSTPTTTAMPMTTTLKPGNCNEGWTRIGNKCVKIFGNDEEHLNWTTAKETCRKYYDDLLSIHSNHEELVITSLLGLRNNTGAVWLGLRRSRKTQFDWIDQSDADFFNWGAGEPSGDMENCVAMETSPVRAGKWRNSMCNETRGYICQDDPNDAVTTATPEYDNRTGNGYVKYGMADYKFEVNATNMANWREAENECKKHGGHLASINSPYEQAFVYSELDSVTDIDALWIGLTDFEENGIFEWSDNWPIFYTDWSTDEPRHPDHMTRCVYLDLKTEEWITGDCEKPMGYICKVTDEVPPVIPSRSNFSCPEKQANWTNIGNDYCYYISVNKKDMKMTWNKANTYCWQQGGSLASIHSHPELDLLVPHFEEANKPIWIGLIRKYVGGFAWRDGSALDFVHWGKDYPNDYTENDCVAISHYNIGWMDKDCSYKYGFICKILKMENEVTTTASNTTDTTTGTGNSTTSTESTTGTGTTSNSTGTQKSTTNVSTATDPGEPKTAGLGGGAIAGIVIGCLVAVAVIGAAAFFFMKRRRPEHEPLISDLSSP